MGDAHDHSVYHEDFDPYAPYWRSYERRSMSNSNRPSLKISVKPRGEGNGQGRISLFAFWRRDGKLSGALDKRVVELAAKLEDGSIVRVKRDAEGKVSHFIDAFEERATSRAEEPAADFGDDDLLPF